MIHIDNQQAAIGELPSAAKMMDAIVGAVISDLPPNYYFFPGKGSHCSSGLLENGIL